MGYLPLHSNDTRAKRVLELMTRLDSAARNSNIECSFTLAAASLLLGQTLDASREELRAVQDDKDALALHEANAAVRVLPENLRDAAIEWVCSWNPRTLRIADTPDQSERDWRWVKKHQRSGSDEPLGAELVRAVELHSPTAEPIPDSVSKRQLLRLMRNGIMHGSVWWTPHPTKRVDGTPTIEGVVIAKLANPAKCDLCRQMLEDRQSKDLKKERYDVVWVRVSAFRKYIRNWAETLAQAGADHDDLDWAEQRFHVG